jgi:hypothetical protein
MRGNGLSEHLKRLQAAEAVLPPAPFGIDDVIRGGRRRRQHRSVAIAAAGLAAVAGLGVAVVLNPVKREALPLPPAMTAPAPTASPVNLSEAGVSFRQSGPTVTVSRNGATVGTVTLTAATYTSSSGRVVLSITTRVSLALATDRFVLYDSSGGENSPQSRRVLRLNPGTHELTLEFVDTGQPEAVGWVPQDGEGATAVWPRS